MTNIDTTDSIENVTEPASLNKARNILPPVTKAREVALQAEAKSFLADVRSVNPHAPEFIEKLSDIQKLAETEIVATGESFSRILDRSTTSVAGTKKTGDGNTQIVAKSLADLRSTITTLTPNGDLTGMHKILGIIPAGTKIERFMQRYDTAQTHLDEIVKSLHAGQDGLLKDNAILQQEKEELWTNMNRLNEYVILTENLENEILTEMAELEKTGDIAGMETLESDILFPVRQRRQDLIVQLTVSLQGYMMMELTRKSNTELIQGVSRAQNTTVYALRVAVSVSHALNNQKNVINSIDKVNEVTNATIKRTSAALKEQTVAIQKQASSSGVSVEVLQNAFNDLFTTLDEVETFRKKANVQMNQTINALTTQLEQAKPNLTRMEALETLNTDDSERMLDR